MTQPMRIALVGCGKMGGAVLDGWLRSKKAPADALEASNFVVVSPREEHRAEIGEAYGVATVADVSQLRGRGPFDMVVLAVKPQVMDGALEGLADACGADLPLVVTMAAGMPTSRYEAALGHDARVVRVMPNMPLQVGMGASVVAGGSNAGEEDVRLVNDLFDALGMSRVVPESQIDAVGAISGSGPAYVAYMVEALRDAGVRAGLNAGLAESLALETVGGTYAAMKAQGSTPEEMRVSVCSPKGTTLAALAAMDDAGFKEVFESGVQAAIRRSVELGGNA